MVESLRRRFHDCRGDASLAAWRGLQLEILEVAKNLGRTDRYREDVSRGAAEPRTTLWAMLGESFWDEHDVARLEDMIERVIVELERHHIPTTSG